MNESEHPRKPNISYSAISYIYTTSDYKDNFPGNDVFVGRISIIINFLYNKTQCIYIVITIYIDFIIIRLLTTNSKKYLNKENGEKLFYYRTKIKILIYIFPKHVLKWLIVCEKKKKNYRYIKQKIKNKKIKRKIL